ncbi:MAG: hypothetical protein ABI978_05750 [Chloroflexota bacterium]
MAFVGGVLAFASFGVGQPGGVALLLAAALAVGSGWGIAAATRWGRYLGITTAIALAGAGAYGIYGLTVLWEYIGFGGLSGFDWAVLAVLGLMGVSSIVLVAALVAPHAMVADAIRPAPRRRAAILALGLVAGVAVAVIFGLVVSTLPEPPCCRAVMERPLLAAVP